MKKRFNGFTLIEILVVIAILGFLISAAMLALNSTRINSRDTKRVSDAKEIQKALEVYYDHYKQYPQYLDSNPADVGWDHGCRSCSWGGDGLARGLEDNIRGDNPDNIKFMNKVPTEEKTTGDGSFCGGAGNDLAYVYGNWKPGYSFGDRQVYAICVAFENKNINLSKTDFKFSCSNGNYPYYCLYSGN